MRSYLLVILLVAMFCKVTSDCDASKPKVVEGNLGQAGAFPWLGVLRVYLINDLGDKPEIALTGLVLIKKTHALVSADDVARIPERIFNEHTHAMFMATTDKPWYYRPKSYKTHEEYETKTVNTIALLELYVADDIHNPLRPICWTRRISHYTSLYLVGYTDENDILEKVIHRMKYAERQYCDNFYKDSELTEGKRMPVHYLCGMSRAKTKCVWENGMVLVSNSSETFSLIGFSIRGPGCAAPAQFIDLHKYYKWVEDATSPKPEVEEDFRRDNEGLNAMVDFDEFSKSNVPSSMNMKPVMYRFDTEKPKYFNVDALDDNTLVIFPFNTTLETYDKGCGRWKVMIYKEEFELKSKFDDRGVAYYKISLYDILRKACGCVKLHIESVWRSTATIAYKEYFDIGEGFAATSSEETPEELKRHFPIFERTTSSTPSSFWRPASVLRPEFIRDPRRRLRLLHYDLYVRFGFFKRAFMRVEMYADNISPTSTTTPFPTARRRFEQPGLTSTEERLEFLKQKRVKLTRPPSRKMWYDEEPKNRTIRSGYVETVPDAVADYFDSDPGTPYNNIYNVRVAQVNRSMYVEDGVTAEPKETYLKFIRHVVTPDEDLVSDNDTIETAPTPTPNNNVVPDFIINAIRSLSSAPKNIYSLDSATETLSKSNANIFQVPLEKFISLNIFVLIFNL